MIELLKGRNSQLLYLSEFANYIDMIRIIGFSFLFSMLLKVGILEAVDFKGYRLGMNNRPLFGEIIANLEKHHSFSVKRAFSREMSSKDQTIYIGEKLMDTYLEPFDAKGREAVATFILAHEYFHIMLQHNEINCWLQGWKRKFEPKVKWDNKVWPLMEKQVDYLAALYLKRNGLPLEPVYQVFTQFAHQFKENKYYPGAKERLASIKKAERPTFDMTLFENNLFQCGNLLTRFKLVDLLKP